MAEVLDDRAHADHKSAVAANSPQKVARGGAPSPCLEVYSLAPQGGLDLAFRGGSNQNDEDHDERVQNRTRHMADPACTVLACSQRSGRQRVGKIPLVPCMASGIRRLANRSACSVTDMAFRWRFSADTPSLKELAGGQLGP